LCLEDNEVERVVNGTPGVQRDAATELTLEQRVAQVRCYDGLHCAHVALRCCQGALQKVAS
jgi:hypothetical protein